MSICMYDLLNSCQQKIERGIRNSWAVKHHMQRRKCMRFCAVLLYLIFVLNGQQTCCRKAWRYQRGNQKRKFEERQIIQWPKGKGQIIWHWLYPWPYTMQLLKSSLYLFQFFADVTLTKGENYYLLNLWLDIDQIACVISFYSAKISIIIPYNFFISHKPHMQRRKCMRICTVLLYLIFILHGQQTCCRKVYIYINPLICYTQYRSVIFLQRSLSANFLLFAGSFCSMFICYINHLFRRPLFVILPLSFSSFYYLSSIIALGSMSALALIAFHNPIGSC
jgi:hypothetical protein